MPIHTKYYPRLRRAVREYRTPDRGAFMQRRTKTANPRFAILPLFRAVVNLLLIDIEHLAEALEMHDLALAQEFDNLVYVGIVA